MSEEWGPWIEHDGLGYPDEVIGRVCQAFEFCVERGEIGPSEPEMILGQWSDGGSWNWANYPRCTKVTSYRIRKPRGLTILQQIARDVKAPEVLTPVATNG